MTDSDRAFLLALATEYEEFARDCEGEDFAPREFEKARRLRAIASASDTDGDCSLTVAAREWGRRGGAARAASLSPERRSEIATAASHKRWGIA